MLDKTPNIPEKIEVTKIEKENTASVISQKEDTNATVDDQVISTTMDGKYEVLVEPELNNLSEWKLPDITVTKKDDQTNGEEDENVFWEDRGRLYRYVDGEWKERATGQCKLLQHNANKRIRLVLRQEKTEKVAANFYIY